MQLCGIYKITNKINNKVYIGQSINIAQRWQEHLSSNDNEFHQELHNNILNFSFDILELCEAKELNQKEIFWIDKYDSYNNGYNLTKGGNSFSPSITRNKRAVKQYDLKGNYIQTFESIKAAQEYYKNFHIGACCRGERKTAGGFQWVFENPKENENIISTDILAHGPRSIIQYDLYNNQIRIFDSIAQAARELNINPQVILRVCQKKLHTAGGYKWSYLNEEPPKLKTEGQGIKRKILQLSKLNDEIIQEYNSISDAAKALGNKSVGSISDACKGKRKSAYGYKWKYVEEK